MESCACLMCKSDAPISLYYVLVLFRCEVSYLVMYSLRMITRNLCLLEWLFNLIVHSLYLVMCTSHLVIISSYILVMCSCNFVQRSFYLVMHSYHSVMCSSHNLLFFMRSYYVLRFALFLCALLMRPF